MRIHQDLISIFLTKNCKNLGHFKASSIFEELSLKKMNWMPGATICILKLMEVACDLMSYLVAVSLNAIIFLTSESL